MNPVTASAALRPARRFRGMLLVAAAIAWPTFANAATRYVNVNLATGADDGSSWENAYRTVDGLNRALAVAASGDEIWVAAGTYKPTTGTTRGTAFALLSGVGIYGGFSGGETALDQRDPVAAVTTLSGDLAGNDPTVTDNSFHVVDGNSANATAILDGFTITAGNASGAAANDRDRGGGIIFLNGSNATIRNCRITANRCTFGGGGTYIRSSSPTFVDVVWQSNQGGSFGGAIDMFTNCSPTFTRCAFIGNAAARAGGVEAFGGCQPVFTNCLFNANAGGGSGGGGLFVASSSSVTLRHTTIAGNTTTGSGSGILTNGSTTTLRNCVVHGNTGPGGSTVNQLAGATTNATYSCVQGGFTGTGNISADPLLTNLPGGNLRLAAASPCIDAADNNQSGVGNTLDFDAAPRFVDDPATADTGVGTPPLADMGAFEFQVSADCPADLNDDGAINLSDLAILLANFGCATGGPPCSGDVDGDGDSDLSDLSILLANFGTSCG